jgi:hypothetical protein
MYLSSILRKNVLSNKQTMHTDEREAVLMNQMRERESDDGLLFVYSYMNYFFLAPPFGCLPSFIIIAPSFSFSLQALSLETC